MDLKLMNEQMKEKNAFLVVGVNQYTDKQNRLRCIISFLKPRSTDVEVGVGVGSFSCGVDVIKGNLLPGKFIQVSYGQARMYNGNLWQPINSVIALGD